MADLSNHLKAVLVLDDVCSDEGIRVNRADCLTLKKFHYRCSRGHDAYRVTGSSTGAAILSMEFKLNSEASIKPFYECMQKNMPHPFTIVFNATFDSQAEMSGYQDAMVVWGYVVEVNDVYNAGVLNGEGRGTVDIKVDLLVASITYAGNEENLILEVNDSWKD